MLHTFGSSRAHLDKSGSSSNERPGRVKRTGLFLATFKLWAEKYLLQTIFQLFGAAQLGGGMALASAADVHLATACDLNSPMRRTKTIVDRPTLRFRRAQIYYPDERT